MLTRLQFSNFKAWEESGPIRLAPLTVLFGANSAGKSSIPQLLLLLKQTAQSPDRQSALQLGDSRSLVDLGTYTEAIHRHELSRDLGVSFTWTLGTPLDVTDPLSQEQYSGREVSFAVRFEADRQRQPTVAGMSYTLGDLGDVKLDIAMRRRESGRRYDLTSDRYRLVRHPGRPWPLPDPVRYYGFPDEATAHYQNTSFVLDLALALERMLGSVYYVGPLREYPKRLYLWSGEVPDHVGIRGDRAIEAILAAGGNRAFNVKPKQKKRSLEELVAERLRAMGMISEFRVEPLAKHRNEYEVLVRTAPGLPEVKLTDVGFGVSQVLPVLVECLYVPRRSIVVFEQPEIHLHPSVQSDLADLFVDAIRAREDGVPRECQFIVETHSEHFLRRLQRRIAEGDLDNTDAALYFVHTAGSSARLEPLEVDIFGNILNWPDRFFGDEMADLVARSKEQARRMAEGGLRS